MRILGIVAEYNPFHHGHLYHLEEARKSCNPDLTAVIMSGHFTQRGDMAIVDKWARTEMALRMGADIVFELPVIWALRSAGDFALGAVNHLAALGATHLCFGSESGDIAHLWRMARALLQETPVFRQQLRRHLDSGKSYPRALALAAEEKGESLHMPNDILAAAYLRAIEALGAEIEPVTIKRQGAGYHDTNPGAHMASASAIRKAVRSGTPPGELPMPEICRNILEREIGDGRGPIFADHLDSIINYRLRQMDTQDLTQIADMEPGLEYRLHRLARQYRSHAALLGELKTKRHTWTRLQRVLSYVVLGISSDDVRSAHERGPAYLRVLGINQANTGVLKHVTPKVPLIYNPSELCGNRELKLDILATDIYKLLAPREEERDSRQDYQRKIVVI